MHSHSADLASKINAFWEWFTEMEDVFQEYFSEDEIVDAAALTDALDDKILDFGLFAWEIGPGVGRNFYLTISPNGNKERLKISKQIIEAAPNLSDWEFNYAKPANNQGLILKLKDDFLDEHEVDASGWNFVLLISPENKKAEIILEAANMHHLDSDTQIIAGDLLLTRLLGEEDKINYVYRFDVVQELEEGLKVNRSPILELGQHLRND